MGPTDPRPAAGQAARLGAIAGRPTHAAIPRGPAYRRHLVAPGRHGLRAAGHAMAIGHTRPQHRIAPTFRPGGS